MIRRMNHKRVLIQLFKPSDKNLRIKLNSSNKKNRMLGMLLINNMMTMMNKKSSLIILNGYRDKRSDC
jgi:hypothetical protein